ncbi:MAG: ribonuclease III [Clostridia bacterium]|nr:ribonuclease III [Clostridia bacterium]MBR5771911.1 ribonuclease III [Clostridia bacterium]
MDNAIQELQERLGYKFKDISLLETALTHSSYANEKNTVCNERLEFLGDAVLGFVSANYLFKNYSFPEGELTKHRAARVCETALCVFAKELKIGEALRLGKGEERMGGREKPSMLADAFEAVLAAVYLDAGLETASEIALRFVARHDFLDDSKDYKTMLQEVIQRNPEEHIEYVLVGEEGPAHMKSFAVEVHLNSNVIGSGQGKSKKIAEQNAAKEALSLMGLVK